MDINFNSVIFTANPTLILPKIIIHELRAEINYHEEEVLAVVLRLALP